VLVHDHPLPVRLAEGKQWRAIATRYEKIAQSFLGILCLAATADWIKI
jgi:hypothetical protein